VLVVALAVAAALGRAAVSEANSDPITVVVPSGALRLRALLWRPRGRGPFPAVLFNHGAGQGVLGSSGGLEHSMEWQARVLGPVFARHGYVFLYSFRRGTGPSAGQGTSSSDRWDRALAAQGQEERNRLQLELLESVELDDALAALTVLRARPEVDARRVAVAGHSFGGSLTLLVAEHESTLRAAVVFSGSARSWPLSPPLRARLLAAADHTVVPVFLVFAANDYSVTPGEALDAEMTRLGKPHRLKIYPAAGHTAQEGHGFVHTGVATWEPDVFAFLDPLMQ
jgi:carboxymethylenebutenolidase